MSKHGAKFGSGAADVFGSGSGKVVNVPYVPGMVEEPAPAIAPTLVYVLERDGDGWRPSVYEVPTSLLVQGKRLATHEPDLKALAMDQLIRHMELRER